LEFNDIFALFGAKVWLVIFFFFSYLLHTWICSFVDLLHDLIAEHLLLGLLIISIILELWDIILNSFIMQIHVVFMDVFVEINIFFISILCLIHDCNLDRIVILYHPIVISWLYIWTIEKMFNNSALAFFVGLRDAVFTIHITNLVELMISVIKPTMLSLQWCLRFQWSKTFILFGNQFRILFSCLSLPFFLQLLVI